MRSKADETFVIVETLICPLQISHLTHKHSCNPSRDFVDNTANIFGGIMDLWVIAKHGEWYAQVSWQR